MTIAAALLLATLAADPAKPVAAPPAPSRTAPRPSVASLPTVEGELLEVDHRTHRFRLRTAEGELLLSFDRNTLVRAPAGASSPLLLTPGARVRAGRDGETRAAWLELRPPPSTPNASP